jgi:hypothetical protein
MNIYIWVIFMKFMFNYVFFGVPVCDDGNSDDAQYKNLCDYHSVLINHQGRVPRGDWFRSLFVLEAVCSLLSSQSEFLRTDLRNLNGHPVQILTRAFFYHDISSKITVSSVYYDYHHFLNVLQSCFKAITILPILLSTLCVRILFATTYNRQSSWCLLPVGIGFGLAYMGCRVVTVLLQCLLEPRRLLAIVKKNSANHVALCELTRLSGLLLAPCILLLSNLSPSYKAILFLYLAHNYILGEHLDLDSYALRISTDALIPADHPVLNGYMTELEFADNEGSSATEDYASDTDIEQEGDGERRRFYLNGSISGSDSSAYYSDYSSDSCSPVFDTSSETSSSDEGACDFFRL